jgi:hypothetical protein
MSCQSSLSSPDLYYSGNSHYGILVMKEMKNEGNEK